MQTLYCWRCRRDMPMLDEAEFKIVWDLYGQCMRATKEFRERHGLPIEKAGIEERFEPVRKAYEQLTGMANCHQNAVMHHRLSDFGPPCAVCGKPLRTPKAKHCAECGAWRSVL
jgi:hypothetical protein